MDWISLANNARERIASLGGRRLAGIGIALTLVIAIAIFAAVQLGRPAQQVLYSGLSKQDSGRIAAALRDANVQFDASADSTTIYVPFGEAPRVRMLLARKGLPNSTSTGYELFDKIGTFGLTSFMQEITKLRALEGELARTIQSIKGVRSARVHIVLPNPNALLKSKTSSSASVVLETVGAGINVPVAAIRHLIASALPGLAVRNVTIVTADGTLLASPDDPQEVGHTRTLALEHKISNDIRRNIAEALSPYLAASNFRVSVLARVDADRKKSVEKVFLPDSRVERSVRVVRETSSSTDGNSQKPTSVRENIPNKASDPKGQNRKDEASQKRLETTNYEISSRTTNIDYSGYQIKSVSIAVVINRASLAVGTAGAKTAAQQQAQIASLKKLIEAASGLSQKRGDRLELAVVDFKVPTLPENNSSLFSEVLLVHSAPLINALFVTIIALLLVFLGVRPALRYVFAEKTSNEDDKVLIAPMDGAERPIEQLAYEDRPQYPPGEESVGSRDVRGAFKRLIESREDDAVMVMKQWIARDAA
ncbi:MAG: flagellar M-ring protein FliF [Hyphomicrobiales bacterium]|nr:flagellar M-ring protein FliF [Hyphomicrobiales bacterium]